MLHHRVIFITGIDTDAGKTYATGFLAKQMLESGIKVITQKLVQTGQAGGISEDILQHRRLMQIEPLPIDENHLTCPYRFACPASPALAAELECQKIQTQYITSATEKLLQEYDTVLLEGTGGILVPLTETLTAADYIAEQHYPVIIVTSAKLGSINHTLLTLEALQNRHILLAGMVFNHYPPVDETLRQDTLNVFRKYCSEKHCGNIIELPNFSLPLPPTYCISQRVPNHRVPDTFSTNSSTVSSTLPET